MTDTALSAKAEAYLDRLCEETIDRRVGSPGNRAATEFFSTTLVRNGFEVETPTFECIDWCQAGALVRVGDAVFDAYVSPYSRGGYARGPLYVASSLERLEAATVDNAVLLLRGELTREPLMPKAFPFYNPEEHQRIIRLVETKAPLAIVAATSRSPATAGAIYPFPLIEDGDFDIPSVYIDDREGARLAAHAGDYVSVDIRALRCPSQSCNVIGRTGTGTRRVVCTAHIDTKEGTPGALDNAGGLVVLLLLGQLLEGYAGDPAIEIAALNGEDHYASPGQQHYLASNEGRFDEIVFAVNLDGVGFHRGATAYSLYDCPPDVAAILEGAFACHPHISAGDPWYQGDHSLFLMNDVPAVALTSEYVTQITSEIVHTSKDAPELVDTRKLVECAVALHSAFLDLVRRLA